MHGRQLAKAVLYHNAWLGAWAAVRAQVCLPRTARRRAQRRASALPTLRRAARCKHDARHSSPVAHASLRAWPAPLTPKLPTHSAAVAHPDACAPREHPHRTTSASTSCGLGYHAARGGRSGANRLRQRGCSRTATCCGFQIAHGRKAETRCSTPRCRALRVERVRPTPVGMLHNRRKGPDTGSGGC